MKYKQILLLLSILPSKAVLAGYSIYDGQYGNLTTGLFLETASFGEIDNQSGGSQKYGLTDGFIDINIKPHIEGSFNTYKDSRLYGGFSYAYTSSAGHDPSGFTHHRLVTDATQESDYTNSGTYLDYRDTVAPEDLYAGWRSGKILDSNESITFDISGGRQKYNIGSGFLISYGADNGGNRGGGYLWPRTSFDNTIIGRINIYNTKLEGFYLETRPLDPAARRSYAGTNLEHAISDTSIISFSYINTQNKRTLHDDNSTVSLGVQTVDNDTFDGRFEFSPLENFKFNSEYAYQVNRTSVTDRTNLDASGGFGQLTYKREDLFLKPALSYRYAIQSENFDGMSPGMTDWGTWFQGEISGMWMLYNTNLITHMTKLDINPREDISTHLIYFNYSFVDPTVFEQTSSDYGDEVNLITDWQYNESLKLTASLASFIPNEGGKEYMGGDANKTWLQAMFYASYNY